CNVDPYLVPSTDILGNPLARGGELITEKICQTGPCQFPDYPGTVAWKFGYQANRDAAVDDNGQEITAAQIQAWKDGTAAPFLQHRTRFDFIRKSLFHYVLYAHARGKPKSLPCIVHGLPADFDVNGTSCTTNNPAFQPLDYHVPSSSSGVADLPGGNA